MDNKFTELIKQWLEMPRDQRDYSVGAVFARCRENRSLHRMMQFATTFPDIKIVTPLVTQLSWSHFLQVIVERAKMRIAQSKMEKGMPMYNDNTTVEPDSADN